jgi:hypothetical protein
VIGAYAAIPFVLALAWNWLNPHAFSRPASTDNWASKAVLGERVWLNRDVVPVPAHHRRLPAILSIGSGIGLLFVIWGVVALAVWRRCSARPSSICASSGSWIAWYGFSKR